MVVGLFVVLLLATLKLNCGAWVLIIGAIPITDLLRFAVGDSINWLVLAMGTLVVACLLCAATFDMITEAAATAPAGGGAFVGDIDNGLFVLVVLIKNGVFFTSW